MSLSNKFCFACIFSLVLTVGSFWLSCAGSSRVSQDEGQQKTMLEVENTSWLDMRIYVLDGGQRIPLGTVTALSTSVLTIPASLIQMGRRLQFMADPIGSQQRPVSQEIEVQPGERIHLYIPSFK